MAKVPLFCYLHDLCNRSWPGQIGSCDHPEITLQMGFAQCTNDLVGLQQCHLYCVCVLDSEGQQMGLESLLMVEPFFLISIKLWHHCYVFKKNKPKTTTAHIWSKSCTFLAADVQKTGLQSRLCFSVQFCRGRSKRGSAPRGRHCRMRLSVLLASPT